MLDRIETKKEKNKKKKKNCEQNKWIVYKYNGVNETRLMTFLYAQLHDESLLWNRSDIGNVREYRCVVCMCVMKFC